MRSPFLVSKAPNSPPTPKKGLLGPGWLCKRATLGMSFGPNELPNVALAHCHSGRTSCQMWPLRIVIRAEREQDRTFTDDSEWLFKDLGAVFVCFI